jgi:hypothetical protein
MNITPKEKAKELVDYFQKINSKPVKLSDYSRIYLPTAKLFAKKVCSEVLGDMGADRDYAFWTEVNDEIDNYNGE